MPVLVEGISVIFRVDAIEEKYPNGWEGFARDCPNNSLCADGDLARVGFMSPQDTKRFVSSLASHGLTYLDDGEAVDLVVADQRRGFPVPCEWAELLYVPVPGKKTERIVACRAAGSDSEEFPGARAYAVVRAAFSSRPKRFIFGSSRLGASGCHPLINLAGLQGKDRS